MKKFLTLFFASALFLCFSSVSEAAISCVRTASIPLGKFKMVTYTVTLTDVTSGECVTGLNNVVHAWAQDTKTDAEALLVSPNSASASTTEDDLGSVFISGATSGDTVDLLILGH